MVQEDLQSIAFLKAGYAVACYDLKLGIEDISIDPDKQIGSNGLLNDISFPKISDSIEARWQMEKIVVSYLAGYAAEKRFNKADKWGLTQGDLTKILDFMAPFLIWQEEFESYLGLLRIRAEQMVQDPLMWQEIEELANKIMEYKEISAKKVRAIIRNTFIRSFDTWKQKQQKKKTHPGHGPGGLPRR